MDRGSQLNLHGPPASHECYSDTKSREDQLPVTQTKAEILRQLSIGSRVAEDEVEQLSRYFVETDQWRRILAGEVDIVFGPKGAGKSAIYTSLVIREDDLFDRRILVVAGENPRGTPAFTDIVAEPPTSDRNSSDCGSSTS